MEISLHACKRSRKGTLCLHSMLWDDIAILTLELAGASQNGAQYMLQIVMHAAPGRQSDSHGWPAPGRWHRR